MLRTSRALIRQGRMVCFYSALAMASATACSQDPAFTEKARNVTSDDVVAAKRSAEGEVNKEKPSETATNGSTADDPSRVEVGSKAGTVQQNNGSIVNNGSVTNNGTIINVVNNGTISVTLPGMGDADGKGKRGGSEQPSPLPDGTPVASGPAPIGTPVAVHPTPVPTKVPAPAAHAGSAVVVSKDQAKGKADILWIVDDSGSMKWAQNQLNANISAFANKLNDSKIDFQVGVTTTDACQIDWTTGEGVADEVCPNTEGISGGAMVNGKMVGPPRGEFIIDAQSGQRILKPGAGFVEAFKRVAGVGIEGSGMENGLTAAKMAVQKAMSGVNGGFLRSDAFLSVVVISDEEDDAIQNWCEDAWGRTSLNAAGAKDLTACKKGGNSPFLDMFGGAPYAITNNPATGKPYTQYKYTADMFKAYLDDPAVKGPGRFRVNTITGIRGADGKIACDNPAIKAANGGPSESGTNYIKAANLTGGVVDNICSANWSQVLSNIGQNIADLSNKVQLPSGKIPFPGTLVVRVDGAVWDASKYTYEANGNLVSFKTAPTMGAKIEISYKETAY